jgi:hypothetical protein
MCDMSRKAALHSLAEITGSFGESALNIFAPFSTEFGELRFHHICSHTII